MSSKALLAQLRKRREHSVDLGGRRTIKKKSPPEIDFPNFLREIDGKRVWFIGPDDVRKYASGWSGFTEADVLGAAIGSSDPIDFDADLWIEMAADKSEWLKKMADALLDSMVTTINERAEVAKNSLPDSTDSATDGSEHS